MTKPSAFRFWAPVILLGAVSLGSAACTASGQNAQAATQSLLDKAHALEVRGRMDMAAQTWQQVLLADPNNTEALGGLARSAKLSGNQKDANAYIERLRAISPNDPGIQRAENMGSQADHNAQLQQAGKLAQQGQYAQAMGIYRKVYGDEPPQGDQALAFYETEAATEDGRAHAIAGLRRLSEKNPADSRYQIALGRILTYNPQTRPEGRRLLAAHPADPQAVEALRQSLVWDSQNPASAGDIRAYLARHPDPVLAQALRNQPAVAPRGGGKPGPAPVPQTAEQRAASAAAAGRNAESQAAYRALNVKHLDEAETRFKAILVKSPDDPNALAGMGYIRMQQANFGGALSFLTQAKQNGSKDPGVENGIQTSRFFYTMGEGAIALNENDLPTAEKQYRLALGMRPTSVEALEGLGGTLLKAEQSAAAIPYFAQFVKLKPSAPHAWRGLFLAEFGSGDAPRALLIERQIPAAPRAELMKDPLFLRALSSAYSSVGRDADAQRVLRSALELPFPADARGLEADTQLQYAGLLQQANHLEQAAGLYRQVLAKNQNNTSAWQGLVRVEHQMANDSQALQTLESMPPASYAQAMKEPGFESTVAAVYQSNQRLDVAQDILEKAITQQQTAGQKPFVANEVQLAGLYLERGNAAQAYPLYQQLINENPDQPAAWKGVLNALHSAGRDEEALAEIQQIPSATRARMEDDPEFLQVVGGIYVGLGQPQQAQVYLRRTQQHYAQQHATPPADVDIQSAWLLYNGMNDTGLYRQLLMLGDRRDLTDAQRRTVQTIWANWAVRRANLASAAGNSQRALAILNATAHAFPGNPGVIKALAGGYASAGLPKQAVLIWKAQDLKTAPAGDYKAAVGAALAANDTKDAEIWLRFGLEQYPKDPDLLILGAKFEQARGDSNRAADYYRASLHAMPEADPGAELANELSHPAPAAPLPTVRGGQDLVNLLSPANVDGPPAQNQQMQVMMPTDGRPYLPSAQSGYGTAPIQLGAGQSMPSQMGSGQMGYGQMNYGQMSTGQMSTGQMSTGQMSTGQMSSGSGQTLNQTPAQQAQPAQMYQPGQMGNEPNVPVYPSTAPAGAPVQPGAGTRTKLKDYVPQGAMLTDPIPAELQKVHGSMVAVTDSNRGHGSFVPEGATLILISAAFHPQQQGTQQQTVTQQSAPAQNGTSAVPQQGLKPGPLTAQPAAGQTAGQTTGQPAAPAQEEVYGAYVPYHPPAPVSVQLGNTPVPQKVAQPEVTDVLPKAQYVPNAKTRATGSSHADVNASNAAAIRRRQSDPPRAGESKPPVEDYSTAPTEGVQYRPGQGQPTQVQQTQTQSLPQQTQTGGGYGQTQPAQQGQDGYGQQYPQPYSAVPRAVPHNRRPSRPAPAVATQPATVAPAQQPVQGLSYPGIGQGLSYQPYPVIGPAYPLGAPPTDYDLMQRRVPPLRGSYEDVLPPQVPLTPRQQTERDLQALEASYSGWLGGTGSARYRSGTVGLDRLTDLEATVEASATVGNNLRFTIVPRAVFLNSGTLDVTQYAGLATNAVPFLGTLPASAINQPGQQVSNGIGGEFQVSGRNFAAAIGYTPYEFLVRNFTGRVLFKPTQHFTIYANRDSVTETQLSYAGLRDPGSATGVFGGNIWGGVVQTGGGVRFDAGDEHAGFYLTADGADITGYHVLENNKFEGSAGAYFLAHNFPGYGRLNVGASMFGMHYAHNERGLTYGLGGYFSPDAYFLASIPVTFIGRYTQNFHYTIAGSVGVQTFSEDSQVFFPLDRGIQTGFPYSYPTNSNTGGNYSINAEGAYRITEHWFGGGFLSANNTNNYNTVTGGFFVRYLFRPQVQTEDYPTGLFPVEGFRPLRVP